MAPLFTSPHDRRARTAVRRQADAGFLDAVRAQSHDDDAVGRGPITGSERRAVVVLWLFVAGVVVSELAHLFRG